MVEFREVLNVALHHDPDDDERIVHRVNTRRVMCQGIILEETPWEKSN